jgi:short-subunit dehydrogenase
MRLELKGTDIFVSLIEPGPITSDFRKNALAKFIKNIDTKNSSHAFSYKEKLKGLQSEEQVPFTLGSEAVLEVLIDALEAKKPKARYRVTKPTKLFSFLKRILSTNALDFVLNKVD